MNNVELLAHVDHTLLTATASWAEIEQLCNEAIAYKTASVCVPPAYVRRIAEAFPNLNICTVIGFPLGYSTTAVKAAEIETALADGASETDAVIRLGDVKNGAFSKVTEEIAHLKKCVGSRILKVIVETCYLDEHEKIQVCRCVSEGGADYIKTSTGFGTAGATREDVLLFKKHIDPRVKIKASGGIRTRKDMEDFIAIGADRLGMSSAIKALAEAQPETY
jgi:deoxyribose-phosphate aldolase